MPVTERELWLLNFYRNSEPRGAAHGAAGAPLSESSLLHATKHWRPKRVTPRSSQRRSSPSAALDPASHPTGALFGDGRHCESGVLLSEILEHRVLTTYRAHLQRPNLDPTVRKTIAGILEEMEEEHGQEHAGWIDQALHALPEETVHAAEARWHKVDDQVTSDLARTLEERFGKS
jgi:hypothetical protein